jgi:hypothetical protein
MGAMQKLMLFIRDTFFWPQLALLLLDVNVFKQETTTIYLIISNTNELF